MVWHDEKFDPGGRYFEDPPQLPEWSAPFVVKRIFKHGGHLYIVEQTAQNCWNYWQSKDDGKTWAKEVFEAGR